jgi:DNA polymerase III gamma/tau subunit
MNWKETQVDLITKHRPTDFDQVIGQAAVVRSLKEAIDSGLTRQFIFCGPFGSGKTTLARIVAAKVGCDSDNLVEVDAASYSGVDDMRELTKSMGFLPMTGKSRVYIIDEAHRLSANAWDSLLKKTEEPPQGVYWVFCTSIPDKLPGALNRCVKYELKPVTPDIIFDYLIDICRKEKIDLHDDVIDVVARHAGGSFRKALTDLLRVQTCKTRPEAAAMFNEEKAAEAVELARMLVKGVDNWGLVMGLVKKLDGQEVESIRIVVVEYVTKAVLDIKKSDGAVSLLAILDAFSEPVSGTRIYPILLSLGRLLAR